MSTHRLYIHLACLTIGQPLTPAQVVQETKTAIAAASGPTLLCLDGDGHVLSLLWILYEAWCTASLKGGHNLRVMCAEVITAGHVLGVLQQVSGADCEAGEWSGPCSRRVEQTVKHVSGADCAAGEWSGL